MFHVSNMKETLAHLLTEDERLKEEKLKNWTTKIILTKDSQNLAV